MGCSGADDDQGGSGDQRDSREKATTTTTSGTSSTPAGADVEGLLRSASLTEQDHGLPEDTGYAHQTGLDTPTFGFCDLPPHGDDQRVARTQQWWVSDQPVDAPFAMILGNEVVLYEGDGIGQYLEAFAELPQTCPQATLDEGTENESHVLHRSIAPPEGLPEGTVALQADRGYTASGMVLEGRYLAIPHGDVLAVLYVWVGPPIEVELPAADLSKLLAERMAGVSDQLG